MNYVFIDVDGVLKRYQKYEDYDLSLDTDLLTIFANFVHAQNCKVVISSDWKRSQKQMTALLKAFKYFDIEVYDKTPNMPYSSRYDYYNWHQDEIKLYIKEHLSCKDNYVIFDDADLSCDFFGTHFIRTKYTEGLREKNISTAIKILNGD